MAAEIRLQKYLAHAGVASRRKCEEMIRDGRVSLNGKIVTAMGIKIIPGKDKVSIDNKSISSREQHVYILLNKPSGYVTTLSDPQGRPIVTSLLQNVKERVFPVGRLDLDTEGALLLTNDGELAQSILHPSNEVYKTYEAEVRGIPDDKKLRLLKSGIVIDNRKTAPATITYKNKLKGSSIILITIHEGRKRQVKKMFQAIGHPVIALKRLSYGRLELGALKTGKYKFLGKKDINLIFSHKKPFTNKNIAD